MSLPRGNAPIVYQHHSSIIGTVLYHWTPYEAINTPVDHEQLGSSLLPGSFHTDPSRPLILLPDSINFPRPQIGSYHGNSMLLSTCPSRILCPSSFSPIRALSRSLTRALTVAVPSYSLAAYLLTPAWLFKGRQGSRGHGAHSGQNATASWVGVASGCVTYRLVLAKPNTNEMWHQGLEALIPQLPSRFTRIPPWSTL